MNKATETKTNAHVRRFKPYSAYKESDVEWLGKVPKNWKMLKLKHIAAVNFSSVDKHTIEDEEPVLLCNYTDVYYNDYITPDKDYMKATATPSEIERFSLRRSDVLVTKDSEEWSDIAVSAYVTSDMEGVLCGYHLAHIRPHSDVFGKYLFRAFSARGINDQFRVEATGITRYGLGKYGLDNALFPVPPFETQRAIAVFLDRETARIDQLIAKKERQVELLQEKRSALISHAVTKGLNPKAKMKDSGIEWLGEIPEHWAVKPIKRIGTIKYGLGTPPEQRDDGVAIIRATDIHQGKIYADSIQRVDPDDVPWSRDPELRANDIIVVRSGAYTGDSAIVSEEWDGAIAGYDMVLRVKHAIPQFISYALLSKYLLEGQIYLEKMRAAQPHLNAEELGSFYIVLPPYEEQKSIVRHMDEHLSQIDIMIAKIETSSGLLREYRTAVISGAVTGKIDVRGEAS